MSTCPVPFRRAAIRTAIPLYLYLATAWCASQAVAKEISFSGDVRPILAEYCVQCHGPDEPHRQADLRLDIADESTAAAIVPGDPDASEMILRLTTEDPDLRMPPPEMQKRPTARGDRHPAPLDRRGRGVRGALVLSTDSPSRGAHTHRPRVHRHRSLYRRRAGKKWAALAPQLDRRRLIRRASFDLIGLPPTPAEVEAFVNDAAPDNDAFAKVIDRLLQSPRYGERWGRHWLDIARYADTHGGSAIGFTRFPFSYTYRDYVISAFNEDLPYDEFVLQQLAADQLELPPTIPPWRRWDF